MKVQFVSPIFEYRNEFSLDINCLGLLYLASIAKNKEFEVEIYDQQLTPKKEIRSKLDGNIIGVTSYFNFHEPALDYLRLAKENGAITIMGGPNATTLVRKILFNNSFVDYVFCGDAETSFSQFLEGIKIGDLKPENIHGLCYRKGKEIYQNPSILLPILDDLPTVDLENLVDKEQFLQHYALNRIGIRRGYITLSGIRGCQKAVEKGRCKFCSIHTTGLRTMNPRKWYQQIMVLQEKYNANQFLETGDDFIIPEYLDALLAEKPSELNFELYVQASLEKITPEIAKKLRRIGVGTTLLGIETLDPEVMKEINKSREQISAQIKFLLDENIRLRLSMIYGLPGESEDTLQRTQEELQRITEKAPENSIVVRPRMLLVLPGSALFSQCLKNDKLVHEYNQRTGQDLRTEDKIDHLLLRELFIKAYTSLTVEEIAETIEEQRKLLPTEVRPRYL